MKRYVVCLLVILMFIGCQKHIQKDEHLTINTIPLKDLGYSIKNIESINSRIEYYYSNNRSIYIVTANKKKVIGVSPSGYIFLELGDIQHLEKTAVNEKIWKENIKGLLKDIHKNSDTDHLNKIQNSKRKNSEVPTMSIHSKYQFDTIGKIGVDFEHNIYVENRVYNHSAISDNIDSKEDKNNISSTQNNLQKKDSGKDSYKVEVLKFSPKGKFLYRIGMEGRDNTSFRDSTEITNFYFDRNNGIWIQYLENNHQYIRFYTNYGKNINFFLGEKFIETISTHFSSQKDHSQKYRIEGIYPIFNKQKIIIIVNIYKKKNNQFNITDKKVFSFNKDYSIDDIWSIDDPLTQVYGTSESNNLYLFSYDMDLGKYLLNSYDIQGNHQKTYMSSISYKYFKRLDLSLNQNGKLVGVFLKRSNIVFVVWN